MNSNNNTKNQNNVNYNHQNQELQELQQNLNEEHGNYGDDNENEENGDNEEDNYDNEEDEVNNEELMPLYTIFMNIMDINNNLVEINNNANNIILALPNFNETVDSNLEEIMIHAHENCYNVPFEVINSIHECYLQSMSYYDENNELIRSTINKVYNECLSYNYKVLTSAIINYSINGMNYIFNHNYEKVEEEIKITLKRLLRFELLMDITPIRYNIQQNQTGEDVKLLVDEEEIEKIPKICYNELEKEIKEKNTSCIICNDEYNDEDIIRKLKCVHIYHKDCIDKWLKEYSYKCPCCRTEVAPHKAVIN